PEPRLLEQLQAALPTPALASLTPARGRRLPLLATAVTPGPMKFEQARDRLDREFTAALRKLWPAVMEAPPPADERVRVETSDPPNVLVLVLESLRHTAVNPESMPRLHRWAQGGLRFQRHYAGSNRSEYGIFALLHARHPVTYDATLDAGILPQTCVA